MCRSPTPRPVLSQEHGRQLQNFLCFPRAPAFQVAVSQSACYCKSTFCQLAEARQISFPDAWVANLSTHVLQAKNSDSCPEENSFVLFSSSIPIPPMADSSPRQQHQLVRPSKEAALACFGTPSVR
jgi:hypothetical protein